MTKLICFDFDNTITDFNSWEKFNTQFGLTYQEDSALFNLYKKEIISYESWLQIINQAIAKDNKLTDQSLLEFAKSLSILPESKNIFSHLKNEGYKIAIISGGIKQLIDYILADQPVDEILTTSEIVWDQDGRFSKIIHQGDEALAKLNLFKQLCRKYDTLPQDTIMVGAGGNDIEIFKASKQAILIGDNKTLEPFAKHIFKDLKSIQSIL